MAGRLFCWCCSKSVVQNAHFCGACGSDITHRYCPYCSLELERKASKFSCPVCLKSFEINSSSIDVTDDDNAAAAAGSSSSSSISSADGTSSLLSPRSAVQKTMNLDEFYKRKSEDRVGFAGRSKKEVPLNTTMMNNKKGKKRLINNNVNIHVGIILRTPSRDLKIQRGSKVSVSVPKNADVASVKSLAIDRHANLNQY